MSVIPFPRQTAKEVEIWELPSRSWIVAIAGDQHEIATYHEALAFAAGVAAVTQMQVIDWASPHPDPKRGDAA